MGRNQFRKMRRRLVLLSAYTAICAASGSTFDEEAQFILAAAAAGRFTSPYWVRPEALPALFGNVVKVKDGALGVLLPNPPHYSEVYTWFNAEQTTHPSQVDPAKAMKMIVSARGHPYPLEVQSKLREVALQKGFQNPCWITEANAKFQFGGIKVGEEPFIFTEKGAETRMYNLEQVMLPYGVSKMMSALTGKPYPPPVQQALQRIRHEKGYTSQLWITKEWMKDDDISLKKGMQSVRVTDDRGKARDYYNLDQVENSGAVLSLRSSAERGSHRNAFTKQVYSTREQFSLKAAAKERGYKSTFWFTHLEMMFFQPPLKLKAEEKPVWVRFSKESGKSKFSFAIYNVEQVVDTEPVEKHLANIS